MLETRAIVVQSDARSAEVIGSGGSGCSACEGRGCGSRKVAQLFCSKPRQFRVDNRIHAGVGDEVIVCMPDGALLRGVGLVYLLPLVFMFSGALLAGQSDARAAMGALFGLLIGFLLAKWLSARSFRQQPYIARLARE